MDFDIDRFFEMERKHSLFDDLSAEGFPLWDVIRYKAVILAFYRPSLGKKMDYSFKNLCFVLPLLIKSAFSFLFNKKNNIFFSFSRYKNESGKFYDKSQQEMIEVLSKDSLIVEDIKPSLPYQNRIEFDFVRCYKLLFRRKAVLPLDFYTKVSRAFEESFGVDGFSYAELNEEYTQFLQEYRYYRFYFKWKNPKRIFYISKDIYKGRLLAAKSLGIKTYETQHGSLTRETFGFSYPDFITGKSHIIVPDYYLTMGKFWNDQLHNPTTFASVGNDYYADKMENIPEDGSILIVSSQLHIEQLASLAVELAKQYPSLTIIYKTRPSESFCHERLQQLFLPYSTIRLINNEVDIKTLLHRSTLAVMIYSTVFFEALHFGTKIAIYKACDYKHLSDYFSLPNVYLFESIRELHAIYLKEKVVSNISVYEKFDRHAFESLISRE